MPIRRCPYCKAIIDEEDKYCNNCGTQLLFPEDEFIEEEIPGDKIVDEEEPEEEETGGDTSEEQELEAELEDEEEFIEDEEEGEEEEETGLRTSEQGFDKTSGEEAEKAIRETEESARLETEEAEETEETTEAEEKEEAPGGRSGEEPEPQEEAGREPADQEREEEEVEEEEEEVGGPDVPGTGEPIEPWPSLAERAASEGVFRKAMESDADKARAAAPEPGSRPERKEDSEKKYEVAIEEDELVIKTKDMARLSRPADWKTAGKKPIPDTGSLPPWVSRIRETPATIEPDEETRAEPRPVSREWTTDSGIGIPERITQAALPFGNAGGPSQPAAAQETDHVEEKTEEMTSEATAAGRPASFSLRLRAKAVDWVFVTALWVISLFFTAQVVGVSFFRLVFGSLLPVLAFYLILLGLYFFLFLYFLGETLGDHYFSE